MLDEEKVMAHFEAAFWHSAGVTEEETLKASRLWCPGLELHRINPHSMYARYS
jgi:hypothetical protein